MRRISLRALTPPDTGGNHDEGERVTWTKLSDGLYDDPDMEAISLAAIGAFALMLSYCGKHETDGKLTRARAVSLARGKRALVAELLEPNADGEAPLVVNGRGLEVRRWDKYNPTKAELDERRKEWAERQRKKRRRPRGGPS